MLLTNMYHATCEPFASNQRFRTERLSLTRTYINRQISYLQVLITWQQQSGRGSGHRRAAKYALDGGTEIPEETIMWIHAQTHVGQVMPSRPEPLWGHHAEVPSRSRTMCVSPASKTHNSHGCSYCISKNSTIEKLPHCASIFWPYLSRCPIDKRNKRRNYEKDVAMLPAPLVHMRQAHHIRTRTWSVPIIKLLCNH